MSVVFPRPMPPATRMLSRARMAARSSEATPSSYIFQSRDEGGLVGIDECVAPHRHVGAGRHPGGGGQP